jgi:phosphoenolpyruvate carboxylase
MRGRPYYKISRVVGLRKNQLFPYVVSQRTISKANPYRAKFRIHKGLPGYSGRDINLGNYEEEEIAALAVELFVAAYCLECPEVLLDMSPLLTSCKADRIRDVVKEYPIVATDTEVNMYN